MRLCLLASSKTAAIHLQYHAQTRGVKFSHVIISEPDPESEDVLHSYSRKNDFELFFVPEINSDECATILEGVQPDILAIKVGETIIDERLLEIPSVATLNAHPSLLPNYRGKDAVRWTLLSGDDVGVSVHVVTSDVDGGPVVVRRRMETEPSEGVGDIIERNYYQHSHQAMVDAILEFKLDEQDLKPQKQIPDDQYFEMHPKLRRIVADSVEQNTHVT